MSSPDKTPNPILETALGMIEAVAPGALTDPEKALHDLVPRLRFLVVGRVEKPTAPQLQMLRTYDSDSSVARIRKAVQTGEYKLGPFPGDLAEKMVVPQFVSLGLPVSLRELTEAEKAEQLGCQEDEED